MQVEERKPAAGGVMRHLARWGPLIGIVAAYLVNALAWCVILPMWQGTDEAAHLGLVQYIAETGRLPGREERYRSDEIVIAGELSDAARLPWDPTQRQSFVSGAIGLHEAEIASLDPALRTSFERKAVDQVMLVPPLYGAMGAVVYRMAYERDIVERSFAVRLYAIGLGAVSLCLIYLLAMELWPERTALWATLGIVVAFQPQFAYSTAGGTSDVLALLWFTALTYGMVRALRTGMNARLAVAMGISLGLGLLTKPHLFLTGPALALLFAYLWWTGREERPRVAACAAIVAAIGLLLWSGWAVRSWRLHGNPFYDTLWAGGWGEVENPQYDYALGRYVRDYAISLVEGLWASYWGIPGYLDTPLPPAVYRVLQGLTLVSLAGLGRRAWSSLRGGRRWDAGRMVYLLLALLAVTPVVYLGGFNYRMWRTVGIGWPLMGRHFAGPLAAQMALWLWGLAAWAPKRIPGAEHLLLRGGIVVLNYVTLLGYVLPRYYR